MFFFQNCISFFIKIYFHFICIRSLAFSLACVCSLYVNLITKAKHEEIVQIQRIKCNAQRISLDFARSLYK